MTGREGARGVSRRRLIAGSAVGALVGAGAVGGAWALASRKDDAAATVLAPSSVFDHDYAFTTLGTMGGPVPSDRRAQPANLLHNSGQAILIDVGDGAKGQLGKVGVQLGEVHALVISHLHIDHTGGLFALLGSRIQEHVSGDLAVYGPPGTKDTVDRMLAALTYLHDLDEASSARSGSLAVPSTTVREIVDGSTFRIDDVEVHAVENTHYGLAADSDDGTRYQSLSLRFDMADRSVLYTGDTGPSPAVERLGDGVDLLVSEIIDPDEELAKVIAQRSDIPVVARPVLRKHFTEQHLTADAVADLFEATGARRLVLTHNAMDDAGIARAARTIAGRVDRPLAFADDLDAW